MGHAQGRRLAPLPTVALFLSLRQSDVCALPFHVTQAPCLCPSISSEHPSGRAHCSHVPAAAHDARRAASAIALRTRTLPTPFFPRPRVCPALQPMPRAILVPSIYLTSAPRPSPGGWYASLCPPLSSPALVQCAFLCIVSPRRTIPHHCHPYIRSRTARNPLKSPPPPPSARTDSTSNCTRCALAGDAPRAHPHPFQPRSASDRHANVLPFHFES